VFSAIGLVSGESIVWISISLPDDKPARSSARSGEGVGFEGDIVVVFVGFCVGTCVGFCVGFCVGACVGFCVGVIVILFQYAQSPTPLLHASGFLAN
jgi:hypothetical protein